MPVHKPPNFLSRKHTTLRAIIRQLRSQNQARILPQIRAIVPIRLIRQLVDVEINVPIEPHIGRIRPNDPRVPHVRLRLQGRRIVHVNRILLRHEHVHGPVAVPAEPVGVAAPLTQVFDVVGRALRAQGVIGRVRAEVLRFDAVEIVAGEGGVVHDVAVEGELDAIEAFLDVGQRQAGAALVKGQALVGGDVAWGAEGGGVLGQLAPRLAGAEVEHDEARPALVAAIDNICDTLAGSGGVGSHVETDIVHVGIGIVDAGQKGVGPDDGVVVEVDGYQLWSARRGVWHGQHFRLVRAGSSSVKDPESIVGSDEQGLNADECFCRVTSKWDAIE